MKKLILIDGHALVHRAFHALPQTLASPTGVLTNAVYGFTSVLIKAIKEIKPDYIVATFDLAGPTFRHEEFADYKAHREKAPEGLHEQVPRVKEVLSAFGIPIFEKEGFEADDIIGSICEKTRTVNDLQTIIATGDLDTLQLVEDKKVVVLTLKKGVSDTVLYDEEEVKRRYGLEPEQVVDFKGLKGDPSDNIPGVPGIGEKTASILIQTFGNLDNLYEKISNFQFPISKKDKAKIKPPLSEKLVQKLIENKDVAFFSKKLSTIIKNVDIDFKLEAADWRKGMKREEISQLFKEMGFFSLLKRISEIDGTTSLTTSGSVQEQISFLPPPTAVGGAPLKAVATSGPAVKELRTNKDIAILLEKINKQKVFALDISNDCLNIAFAPKEYFSVSFDNFVKNADLYSSMKNILENKKIKKSGHNLKMISKYLLGKGIHPERSREGLQRASASYGIHLEGTDFDSKLAIYLLNSDLRDYSLDKIYFTELKQNMDPERSREGSQHASASYGMDPERSREGSQHASASYGMDPDPKKRPGLILELKDKLIAKLRYNDTLWVFEKIELPLSIILAEMELNGIKVDLNAIMRLAKTTLKEQKKLEKKIYALAGTEFNINSPQQLSVILFVRLKITGKLKKTGKGTISTAAPELEKLSGAHPVIDLILKYRELQKLKTTYIEPFSALVNKNGRLCTTFNQTGTTTGRLSSEEPNLQNIPIRTDIGQEFRKVFVASPGYKLVSFDYSQLELRIAAHISKDKKMGEAFKGGEDIHTRTAAEIFGVQADKVTTNMRRQAKVLNFGILYGMGILGFQRASGVDRARAKEFIDKYMREFSGIARFMQEMKNKVRKDGYVTTIFGRRRQLPEAFSGMPQLISQAERMAINMPIQGTAADLIKLSMIKIHDLIHDEKSEDNVKLLLQVHDELLFEVKDELVKEWSGKIKNIMENIHKLEVPLIVDAKCGMNWAEMSTVGGSTSGGE